MSQNQSSESVKFARMHVCLLSANCDTISRVQHVLKTCYLTGHCTYISCSARSEKFQDVSEKLERKTQKH